MFREWCLVQLKWWLMLARVAVVGVAVVTDSLAIVVVVLWLLGCLLSQEVWLVHAGEPALPAGATLVTGPAVGVAVSAMTARVALAGEMTIGSTVALLQAAVAVLKAAVSVVAAEVA